jgi:hypothetical protein
VTFSYSEQHIQEIHTQGFTVFRKILPTSLITDLRRACDTGRDRARERHGPQVQRFQPIDRFELDPVPFEAFRTLPVLVEAIRRTLTPGHSYGDTSQMGVLIEPADLPWCTRWHRDGRDNQPLLDFARWESVRYDLRYFGQSNCALYEDHSFWCVPGSHLRGDLPSERALLPTRPIVAPPLDGWSAADRERICLEYCRSMPNAVQLHLEAGDYALYKSSLWHIGSYVPYTRRATLHDFVDTPEFRAWRAENAADMVRRKAAGHPEWEWNLTRTERGENPEGR